MGLFWGFLGGLFGPPNRFKGLTRFDVFGSEALFGLFWLLLVAEDGLKRLSGSLGLVVGAIGSPSRAMLVSLRPILSFQTDLPSSADLRLYYYACFFPCETRGHPCEHLGRYLHFAYNGPI